MPTSDILVRAEALTAFSADFLRKMGCPEVVANEVAAHLVDSDLVGDFVRLPQYLQQQREGLSFQRFAMLRSPRDQVWSMFRHCLFSTWNVVLTQVHERHGEVDGLFPLVSYGQVRDG